jgi:hypothetical protein
MTGVGDAGSEPIAKRFEVPMLPSGLATLAAEADGGPIPSSIATDARPVLVNPTGRCVQLSLGDGSPGSLRSGTCPPRVSRGSAGRRRRCGPDSALAGCVVDA